jgi:hypothetical protein
MSLSLQIGMVLFILYLGVGHYTYTNLIYELTNSGHWEVILCYALLQLILTWIFIKGLNFFPKQDVIDIYLKMGKWVAFICLIPYVIFLIALVAINTRLHSELIISFFLSLTPYWSVLVLLYVITTYIAVNGLGTILRTSVVIFFTIVPLLIITIFSSFVNFDWHNASPFWHPSLDFLIKKRFFYLMGFSGFLPLGFVAYKTKLKSGLIFLAGCCATIFYLFFTYIPLLVFGQERVIRLPYSIIYSLSSVDIRWFMFNQQTIFFALSTIGFTIISNAVCLWIIGRIMHKIVNRKKAKASYWIIASSVIGFIFGLFIPSQAWTELFVLWITGTHVYFMIIIPFSIFIYGFLLKRGRVL